MRDVDKKINPVGILMEFFNIDLHLARLISKLDGGESGSPLVYLAAACASHALQNGHICADTISFSGTFSL